MKNRIWALVLVTLPLFHFQSMWGQENEGEITLTKKSLLTEYREAASPMRGKKVAFNPPALLWPISKGKALYQVRLSKDSSFSNSETLVSKPQKWAFYNVHKPLAEGKWYWQYGVVSGGQTNWSSTNEFEVTPQASPFETASAQEVIKACPSSHPRILINAKELPFFRKEAIKKPEAKVLIKNAKRVMQRKFPDIKSLNGKNKLKDPVKQKAYAKRLSHKFTRDAQYQQETLMKAWLLTGEQGYAMRGIENVMKMTQWLQKKELAGDFSEMTILYCSSLVYDSCYDLLTKDQKETLAKIVLRLGEKYYNRYVNELESRIFDNHVWQHTLRYLTYAGFSLLGDYPQVEEWINYCYGVWIARAPGIGNKDGGWHNGDSYFHVNIESLLLLPDFYRSLTGVNLFKDPWYQNVCKYIIYSQPPFSKSAGFGSSHEDQLEPRAFRIAFADALTRELKDPFIAEYRRLALEADPEFLKSEKVLNWYRLKSQVNPERVPCKPLSEMSKSHIFKDTGIGFMNSDLGNTEENVMVSFRSSPYGCTGHALANQNSFNVFLGGKDLFYSSGYRSHFCDKHTMYSYRNTRAHNSVLADSLSQKIGIEGYGWIARTLDGEHISYILGDASNAYGPVTSEIWLERMREAGIEITPEKGWGPNKMKRFRRHLIMLHPDILVIYDDLEATEPVQWSWMVHSREKIQQKKGKEITLLGYNENGKATASVYGSLPLSVSITDQFFEPAVNWKKKTDFYGNLHSYPNQWHASVSTNEKGRVMRFLSIINLSTGKPAKVKKVGDHFEVKGWTIKGILDPSKEAGIMIKSPKEEEVLIYGPSLQKGLNLPEKPSYIKSTILINKKREAATLKEVWDVLPECAR